MHDWEARALPSEERCERWRAAGGMWLSRVLGFVLRHGDEPHPATQHAVWRPWKDGDPVTWSDFYAATHPPIPEGWEKVGEWFELTERVALACNGTVWFHEGGNTFTSGGAKRGWCVEVRRIAPPIDWPDVPEGVNLPHCGYIPVERDGKRVGIVFPHGALWRSLADGTPSQFDDHPSLPAAIVALTGRRK